MEGRFSPGHSRASSGGLKVKGKSKVLLSSPWDMKGMVKASRCCESGCERAATANQTWGSPAPPGASWALGATHQVPGLGQKVLFSRKCPFLSSREVKPHLVFKWASEQNPHLRKGLLVILLGVVLEW